MYLHVPKKCGCQRKRIKVVTPEPNNKNYENCQIFIKPSTEQNRFKKKKRSQRFCVANFTHVQTSNITPSLTQPFEFVLKAYFTHVFLIVAVDAAPI